MQRFLVKRKSLLEDYLIWAYPTRNFIGQARSRDELVFAVKHALFCEVSTPFRDNEFIMCRYTRFSEIFNQNHILLSQLESLVELDIVPVDYHDNYSDSSEGLENNVFFNYEESNSEDSYSSDSGYASC